MDPHETGRRLRQGEHQRAQDCVVGGIAWHFIFLPPAPRASGWISEECRQHQPDDMREQLAALRLGQRRHALNDGRGSTEDEALELGFVHRADLHLEPRGLEQFAHAGGDDAVKLAGVGDHVARRRRGRERGTVVMAIDAFLARVRLIGYQPSVARQRGRGRSGLRSLRQRPSRSPAAEYASVAVHEIHASAS